MTKSIVRCNGDILVELRKHSIDTILYRDGNIKIGEYDGVDFREKQASKEKYQIAKNYMEKILELLTSCDEIISFVYSDIIYIKFVYSKCIIIAFISGDTMTFNKEIKINEETKEKILNCKNKFLQILEIKDVE
ncbi:hypothetical protein [Acidianus manzaensis]|uniref:Uncharacterized protein n=1 Tax=Acidianus manzaensis TaxID=282676 RepID=A0A1W6JZQ6_9CREN|nr:hypothetical protein [Acidianus manzaensis]ARM75773.1 hypothetical protein B6F84_06810 [Acidianus manzaensis]